MVDAVCGFGDALLDEVMSLGKLVFTHTLKLALSISSP